MTYSSHVEITTCSLTIAIEIAVASIVNGPVVVALLVGRTFERNLADIGIDGWLLGASLARTRALLVAIRLWP